MNVIQDSHPAVGSGLSRPARRRRVRRWWGLALAAAGTIGALWWGVARMSGPALQGGIVSPPAPTYDFALRDQRDRVTRLSALRGRVVVLTFLYTHCPDACPLTAERLHETYARLGTAAGRVAFLAVSVDPKGDTPDAVRAFLALHHVSDELAYLTGSMAQLQRVWADYYVGSDAGGGAVRASAGGTPEAGHSRPAEPVAHTSAVYVIDPGGDLRVVLPGNFDAKDLVTDVRILARGAGRAQDARAGESLPHATAIVYPSNFPGYDAGYDTTQVAQPLTIVRIPL